MDTRAKICDKIDEIQEIVVSGENDRIVAEIYHGQEDKSVEDVIRAKITDVNRTLPLHKQVADVRFRDEEFPSTTTKKIKRN